MINQNLTSDDILKKYNSILINLNIVASINKNDKLYIHNSELVRHPYSSTRVFTRWWNNYNRKDCIKFINELYEDISSLIDIPGYPGISQANPGDLWISRISWDISGYLRIS